MLIAEYRKRDGAVARCLFQKAQTLEQSSKLTAEQRQDASEWRLRASTIALRLEAENSLAEANRSLDDMYAYLVPGEER